jgi:signal transduction histidine kinase/CHASE1-domain containing sensor protein
MVFNHLKTQSVWVIGYVVLASVGIILAVPPGYASPIFPAAGFAVAVMLWSSHRALPAVVLASFLLNFYLSRNIEVPLVDSWIIAILLGLGVGLQAHVAANLVQKAVKKEWRRMESANTIISSLLLAGPVACLIAATNATFVLYVFDVVTVNELFYSWWNWWVGDSLGVLVMMPICLAVLCRHDYAWKNRLRIAFFPVALVILMAVAAFIGASRLEKEHFRKEILEQGEAFKFLLQQRVIAHQEAVAALRRLIEVMPEMTSEQFEYFTRITLMDNPDISALSINAFVLADERADYEQRMRQLLGMPTFQITEKHSNGKFGPAQERQHYVVIQFLSSSQSNISLVGYDINSEPLRRNAINVSLASGKPAATAPLQLLYGPVDTPGLLIMHPAFRQQADQQAGPEIFAFAVAILKMQEMIETATAHARNPRLQYRVVDVSSGSPATMIYQSATLPRFNGEGYVANYELKVADHLWRIEVAPTQSYMQEIRSWTAWAVGVGGLFAVAMLQMLILIITGQNSLIRRKIDDQTRQLRAKSDAIAERNAQLDAIFHCSPDGFIVFADNSTVKYANPALLKMLDLKNERGMQECELDAFLIERLDKGDQFSGVAGLFAQPDDSARIQILNLIRPHKLSLQVLGIHTQASSIPRILYFRDVTKEFETQKMKSDFLSHAAHELRTPMTTILGYTELLQARDYSKEVRAELLQTIQRQTSLIVSMINDLLDLARIEANSQPQMLFSRFDLSVLIREIVGELTFDLKRWPVRLVLPEAAVELWGDHQKMRQAIMNLLVNAQKYSPQGGQIKVSVDILPTETLIAIEDSGIGMTPQELVHIGEKFWRADASGSLPGTGLGVAIVKEIVHSHAGSLHFSSRPGSGTKVTIEIPRNIEFKHQD